MVPHPLSQVFGGDSDEEDLARDKEGVASEQQEDDEFDFIVDDHGQPIRKRREDGTYTEPYVRS